MDVDEANRLTFAVPAGQRVIYPHHIDIPTEKVMSLRKPVTNGKSRGRSAARTDGPSKTPRKRATLSKRKTPARETRSSKKRQLDQSQDAEHTEDLLDMNAQSLTPNGAAPVQGIAIEENNAPAETHADTTTPAEIPNETENHNTDEESKDLTLTKPEVYDEDDGKQESTQPTEPETAPSTQDTTDAVQSEPTHIKENDDSTQNIPKLPKTPSTPQDELILVANIDGPTALTNRIIEIDGRIEKFRGVNAWKEFRCYRNNQDMGSLWELRQDWYLKHHR